ncbi:MAG: ABC transporter ATP-binding protein, partial [Oscillospiraceae bacterium]|nr:ABC transporter ATP-binding protein [Oscillospiraceae bacterium]
NLDAKLRTSMRTELIKLHNKLETTFVYVTHDQTEAMTMGDRIVVMNHAVVQQVDTPQNLYDSPCNMFVAGFIGSPQMNFIDVVLVKDSKGYYLESGTDKLYMTGDKVDDDKLKDYIGKNIKLGVRPEDIYDDDEFISKSPDSIISTHVDVSELMGSEVYLYLKYADYTLTARVAPTTKSRTGDSVKVALNMNNIHLFDAETENAILN